MDPEAAVRRWIDVWSRAWPAEDAEEIAGLYADDAVFVSHPFREPHRGSAGAREYAEWAFEDEQLVECRFGEPILGADGAAVEYWAILRTRDATETTLAGVALIRFAGDGRVAAQRDYWAMDEGRREPPPGWGRGPA